MDEQDTSEVEATKRHTLAAVLFVLGVIALGILAWYLLYLRPILEIPLID